MKTRVTVGLTLLFLCSAPHMAFANAGPYVEPFVLPAWLLILVAILAWLACRRHRKREHFRAVPRLLMGALAILAATVGSFVLLVPFIFIIAFLDDIQIPGMFIGIVFGGIALYRSGQLLLWGWQARRKEEIPPHLVAGKPWRLLFRGGLLSLLAGILTTATILISLNPPRDPFILYRRAVSETKTAVTQAITYANDKGVYPRSMKVLRDEGYANIDDKDPWGRDWVHSPVLTQGKNPVANDEVYVYSRGRQGTGTYPRPFTDLASARGSIGYSSIYGEWRGE
jgi:hypothetical protein